MMKHAPLLAILVIAAAGPAGLPALAEGGMIEFPADPNAPQSAPKQDARPEPDKPAGKSSEEKNLEAKKKGFHAFTPEAFQKDTKGDPGMMGNPWPKTPEEASKTISDLLAHLASAESPEQAGQISKSIERLWRLPGGDTVNLLLDRASAAAEAKDADSAVQLLDAAADLAPDFAEVFSRRAFVYYLKGDTASAVADLRRTLALEPNHFKALEGLAHILSDSGEKKGALKAYEQLLLVNPFAAGAKEAAEDLKKAVEGQGI